MEQAYSTSSTKMSNLWIFGYGSLCWHPGFEFDRVLTGYVSGYSRKFWQGNTTHRGTEQKPGRVATLIEDEQSTVWGCAYEISGETALPYLTNRECKLGGYMTKFATFYSRQIADTNTNEISDVNTDVNNINNSFCINTPITVMIYIATPKNDLWLGDAPITEIANQITECSGQSGHNVEYLLRLAEFMRNHIPEATDDHLFTLEHLVRTKLKERNMCVKSLMGNGQGVRLVELNNNRNQSPEREALQEAAGAARVDTFQYTARVPEKNLRCLNI